MADSGWRIVGKARVARNEEHEKSAGQQRLRHVEEMVMSFKLKVAVHRAWKARAGHRKSEGKDRSEAKGDSFRLSTSAFRLGVAAACAGLLGGPAQAAGYPDRPIRMMIPQPAGGTMDTIARAVSHLVVESVGYNIVIDNRSGANGIIAGETLARAAPDGYTLLYTSA
jgi:hypothetical protein